MFLFLQTHAALLNEAYRTLMDTHRRAGYDLRWREAELAGYVGFTGRPISDWTGPERVQGIFVDENKCIGKRDVGERAVSFV